MKNITRHTGIIENLERLPSSYNGNPRYEFTIDGYKVRTAVDSSYGYSIANHEGKKATITAGTHYGHLTLNSIETIRKA